MMQLSDDGFELIKKHEGLKLSAYRCPAGIWTVGYGHTRGVRAGMRISIEDAESFLREDVADAERSVNELVRVPLSQGQFDALVSFVFNLGARRLARSTLLRLLNAGDFDGAARQFDLWVFGRVNGRKRRLPGLIARREDERTLFELT